MNRMEFDAWEKRIAARAEHLWEDAGRPVGPRDRFIERARELVAVAENPDAGQIDPEAAAKPVIDEASLMENLGEFPSDTDRQGEEPMFPPKDDKPSAQ